MHVFMTRPDRLLDPTTLACVSPCSLPVFLEGEKNCYADSTTRAEGPCMPGARTLSSVPFLGAALLSQPTRLPKQLKSIGRSVLPRPHQRLPSHASIETVPLRLLRPNTPSRRSSPDRTPTSYARNQRQAPRLSLAAFGPLHLPDVGFHQPRAVIERPAIG